MRLVNDVREDIPEIPEIKYYDEQIAELSTKDGGDKGEYS